MCVHVCVIAFSLTTFHLLWTEIICTQQLFLLTSNVQSIKKQQYQMQLLSLFLLLFHFTGHFPGGPGSSSCPLVFFLHLFQQRTFTDKQHRFSMGWLPFLSPNQQHQCTESNTKQVYWLSCGFTSRMTQNRSFRRRSPSQSHGLVWKNKT